MLEKSRAARFLLSKRVEAWDLSQSPDDRWPTILLFVQSLPLYIRIVAILGSQLGISCCPSDHLFHRKENKIKRKEGEGQQVQIKWISHSEGGRCQRGVSLHYGNWTFSDFLKILRLAFKGNIFNELQWNNDLLPVVSGSPLERWEL